MKQLLLSTILLLCISVGCHTQNNSYSIVIPADMYLDGQGEKIDSVWITNDYLMSHPQELRKYARGTGELTLSGTVDKSAWSMIECQTVSGKVLRSLVGGFVLEPGKITMTKDAWWEGTPQNDTITAFIRNIPRDYPSYANAFVKRHSNEPVAVAALVITALNLPQPLNRNYNMFMDLWCQSSSEVQQNSVVTFLKQNYEIPLFQQSLGKKFTDFSAEYNGKVQRLSDYVGKGRYVLVDFWASWCGPCRMEIPNLINVYNKYKDKGVDVVGVATWDKPNDTQRAINELGINYPQIMNAQKAGSDAYGIEGIPEIILFSPDGTILRRELRGQQIENALKMYLEK
ncbi:MAG: TlpA family protein disulfide reductase [Prevotella sp.]|nr:TlpA family protein disulfide reductase [Candidatus Prevotella equi]